jgi:hypothetical protein
MGPKQCGVTLTPCVVSVEHGSGIGRGVAGEDAAPIIPESDALVAACRDGSFWASGRHPDKTPVSRSSDTMHGVDTGRTYGIVAA